MLKKMIISGVALLLIGGVLFGWASYQHKEYLQILAQLNPSNSYWDDVDENLAGQESMNPLTKTFVRSNMKLQLDKAYEEKAGQTQNVDLIFAVSLLLIICGAGVFSVILVDFIAKALIKGSSGMWYKMFRKKKRSIKKIMDFKEVPQAKTLFEPEVIDESDTDLDESFIENLETANQWQDKKKYYSSVKTIYNPEKVSSSSSMIKTVQAQSSTLEDLIKSQFGSLEKQIAEVRQVANAGSKTETEESKVYDKTLTQLTRQVAAINEFASKQQEKVKKLQEGYDWNIIKNFTLRIIRCIDNLEESIAKTVSDNRDASVLEETRDDFVFALESSGVERFKPMLKSEYRGQEKEAEAVAERVATPEQMLKGKIAKVLRPGYKFVIDDETSKIVRTAQVKIYG